jgi:TusA-related sulfurtransferase
MAEEIKADKSMDLKGLPCPMPVVKLSKGIKDIAVGQVVMCETSDPGALADFPAWAKASGNEIVDTVQEGNTVKFYIRRKA